MGPFANDTRVMLGNYEGIPETITSIFAGIQAFQPDTILASVRTFHFYEFKLSHMREIVD